MNKRKESRNIQLESDIKKCTKSLNYGLLASTILLGISLGLTPVQADSVSDNASTTAVVKDNTQPASDTANTQSENVTSVGTDADNSAKGSNNPENSSTETNSINTKDDNSLSTSESNDNAVTSDKTVNNQVDSSKKMLAKQSPVVSADTTSAESTDTTGQTTTSANDTTTQTDYDSATPIAENPKAVVPDGSQKLDGKYAFIPKFNGSGTTTVSVIGTEKTVTKKNTIAADLVNATKGEVGFKYTNVGFDADGNSMDMNILYMDWGRLSETDPAYVETYTTMIYSNFRGAGWGDVKYQFVRSDSGEAETVTGLITLTDIDGNQTVSITDGQWANIDNVYIPEGLDPMSGKTDNWLRYTENDGYVTLVSPDSGNTPSTGQYSMLTFTYTNQSELTFRYSDGLDGSLPTKMTAWGVNYIPQKPLATATVTPTITVSDSDETTVLKDTVKDGESTYTYNINQVIPDEWAQFYYGSVALTGDLPTNTSITGFKVLDEMGNDVTQYFTNASSGQTFKATVNADYLQNSDFYGHRYTIQLAMTVPQTDSVQQLNFSMATTIDEDAKSSNSVVTLVDKKHYLVTHYYIQGTTTSVAPDQRRRVIYGTSYTTNALSIDNYRLAGQVRTSGIFTDENQTAIYEYMPLIVSIPVKYVDQRGKEISPETSLTGRLGSSYDATSLKRVLMGYDLKSVENVTGTYADNGAAIIFHYQAKTITIKIRDIDNYDNDLDKELGLTRTIQGLFNDPYTLTTLGLPEWSEIYSGSQSLLSGTYSDNMTITLHYTQARNQEYANSDGSETIPVYNGLDKLIGVMQVHPDTHEDTTVVLIKPNGKYLVGTLDYDTVIDSFHRQGTVVKGKSVTIISNTGEKIKVSVSNSGIITIAHLNSKTLPVADRASVSADGKTVQQYIDTKSAVNGLTTSTYTLNGEYGFRQATQHWPNGYTTIYDSSNPENVRITVRNDKGKVVYKKSKFVLTDKVTFKAGGVKWSFQGTEYGELNSQLITVNKSGNGTSYSQNLTFGGTLKSTTVATIRHDKVVKLTTLTYGQFRSQEYADEPVSSSANSGKVMGTRVFSLVSGNHWQVETYDRQGHLTGTTQYQLRSGVTVPVSFAGLTVGAQDDWLVVHSVSATQFDSNGNRTSTEATLRTQKENAQMNERMLPQTGEASTKHMGVLGIFGLLLSWAFGLGMRIYRGEDQNE